MIEAQRKFRKLILVCTNERADGTECCAQKNAVELHKKIKEAIKAVTTDVRVSKSGCLDNCTTGATVVIMPDNIWLGQVTEEDIPEIVSQVTE